MITTNPTEEFHNEFVKIIRGSKLTSYGIGHLWAAETDEDPMALRSKVDRWRVKQTKSIKDLILLLDVLGYQLILVKKK